MLTQLTVRDFAIVHGLDLELGPGMTVLTGETGAGKSILVDALGLAIGDRASASAVRKGARQTEVTAVFDSPSQSAAGRWLAEQDLEDEDELCILRRTVGSDGRSRAYVNSRPVTLQALRELGECLVDIHGQHAHQSLLKRDVQRQILDDFGGHGTMQNELAALHARWRAVRESIASDVSAAADADARLDYLRFQLGELEQLGISAGEWERLEEEQRRLAHAAELLEVCARALDEIDADDGTCAATLIASAQRRLRDIERFDSGIGPILELLDVASTHVAEAASELRQYPERIEVDPNALDAVERRMSAVHDLSRKHRVDPSGLPDLHTRLGAEIDALVEGEARLAGLNEELAALTRKFRDKAREIHEARAEAAKRLSRAVTQNLRQLGMEDGRSEVELRLDDTAAPTPHGADTVEFLVSANRGHAPQPLSRVASGGELSRMSLAIQVVATRHAATPTLIFDEVDAGIGGAVAQMVGRQLHRLSMRHQVVCVTHLPQVASQADHHVRVSKRQRARGTVTELRHLSPDERVEEIARMLGGVEITEQSLAHARELLERA